MDYDKTITTLIAAIKADKSIQQPWRNKAAARLEESQAFVRMGLTISRREPTEPVPDTAENACICPPGATKQTCPVHGY